MGLCPQDGTNDWIAEKWPTPRMGHNAVGVGKVSWIPFPRVAAARQPWARGHNAVGVGNEWARVSSFEAPDTL